MKSPTALTDAELKLMRDVFKRHPNVASAILFGSRAKGTHTERSDVDLALTGKVSSLEAETVAADLDELPLPYRFEVQSLEDIKYRPLVEHINRVGMEVYPKVQ